jgi:hypothetical protein
MDNDLNAWLHLAGNKWNRAVRFWNQKWVG